MPEARESDIELAHRLSEGNEKKPRSSRFKLEVEILEVIIQALVAIGTAYTAIKRDNSMDSRLCFTLTLAGSM